MIVVACRDWETRLSAFPRGKAGGVSLPGVSMGGNSKNLSYVDLGRLIDIKENRIKNRDL